MQPLYGGVQIVSEPDMANVARLDLGALPMIDAFQSNGLLIDVGHFEALEKVLAADMERLTAEVEHKTGQYTLLSSGDQVAHLLFHAMGLTQVRERLTPSGERETVDEETLTQIKHLDPVVPLILEFKQIHKLLNTYVSLMASFVKPDRRIHPSFRTTRAATGRLSCHSPNLMAIPVRSARGRDVRRGFIAPPGWCLVSVDLSQIEMRMSAHHSDCAGLIDVYENDEDVYSDFATTAFRLADERFRGPGGWEYPTVDKLAHRTPAKTCVLGVMYDVTASGLLNQMPVGQGWDEIGCQRLIDAFYSKYPEILHARKIDHSNARRYGYIWDMFGRLRHVPEVRSALRWVRESGLRQAGNMPLQSGAQGLIKLVMAEVWGLLGSWSLLAEVKPLLQIHDELLFECRESVADDLIALVKTVVENCCPLAVPIRSSGAKALNWGLLK